MSLLLWILALTAVLLAVRWAAGPLTASRAAKVLLLPGLAVAVAARSIACGLSGAPLKSVNLFWRKGEPVEHGDPKVPVLGPALLALLPLAAAAAAVLGARSAAVPGLVCEVELPDIDTTIEALGPVADTIGQLAGHALDIARGGRLEALRLAVFAYLSISVLLFAAPAWKEWKALAGCLLGAGIIVAAIEWLGLRAGFWSRGWFIRSWYSDDAFEALALILMMAMVTFAVLAGVRGTLAFLRAALGKKGKGGGE